MADEKRTDSEHEQMQRPRRTTLSGRRFGRLSFELEGERIELPPETTAEAAPRRNTAERSLSS